MRPSIMHTLGQIFLLAILHYVATFSENSIPCPLVWTDFKTTWPNHPVTSDLFSDVELKSFKETGNRTTKYLSRIKRHGHYKISSIDENFTSEFNIANTEQIDAFQILTNPYNCVLRWVSLDDRVINPKFLVPVGRKGYFLSANNDDDDLANWSFGAFKLKPAVRGKSAQNTFVLKSSIKPQLVVDIFVHNFLQNSFTEETKTFKIDCDRLHNKGESEISHSILHSKEVSDKLIINLDGGLSAEADGQIELELAITVFGVKTLYGSLSAHLGIDLNAAIGGDYIQDTQDHVSTTQKVNLPPKTQVEVCSQGSIRSTKVEFVGKAKISHPFLSPNDIQGLLENDGRFQRPFNLHSDMASLVAGVQGMSRSVAPYDTQFVSQPLNYFDKGLGMNEAVNSSSTFGLYSKYLIKQKL